MRRLVVILIAGLLIACGGDDSGTDLPSIDAAKKAAAEAGEALGDAADSARDAASDAASSAADSARDAATAAGDAVSDLAETDAGDGQSATCLELVGSGEFAQAVPACTAALASNPANEQVQEALATAKSEAGTLTDAAGAMTDAAKQGAQEAASDKAADAVGGVLGN